MSSPNYNRSQIVSPVYYSICLVTGACQITLCNGRQFIHGGFDLPTDIPCCTGQGAELHTASALWALLVMPFTQPYFSIIIPMFSFYIAFERRS